MWDLTDLFFPCVECKLAENRNWSVMDAVFSLTSVQVAIIDLFRSLDIKFDFVIGHR